MNLWEPIQRFLFPARISKLDDEAEAVTRLAGELKSRLADLERRSDDPFTAMTRQIATNHFEDRQEANIWRGNS